MTAANDFKDGCSLCRIVNTKTRQLPEYDQPIIQTPSVVVIPALGHFIDGYLLICTRLHVFNLGVLGRDNFEQFLEIKKRVQSLLIREYGQSPVFFEHGPASSSLRGGSCIDHAHMHAMPVECTTPPLLASRNLKGGRIEDIHAVLDYAKSGKPYFFFECTDGAMYLYHAPVLPCQFGRQVMADIIGVMDRWDWRRHQFHDAMIETSRRLRRIKEG